MTLPLSDLAKAGLHIGHKKAKWNPRVAPFLHGSAKGIHIFNLEHTARLLADALSFIEDVAAKGGTVLLVSTKQQTADILPAISEECGMPYVSVKWYGGLLTNWETTKSRIKKMQQLREERDENGFEKYIKKERSKLLKDIERMENWYAGIADMQERPDAVFILDTVKDRVAVKEANTLGIPAVGMADSNADPDLLSYPIPGSDDAVAAIDLVLTHVRDAINEGKKKIGAKKESDAPKEEKKSTAKKAAK